MVPPDHDPLYHRFFSDPAIVAQLLREFVAGPWLDGRDLDGLERLNTKFHAETGERREGDLVWRIPRRGGEAVGRQEGAAAVLLRQLARGFGALPDWARDRVLVGEAVALKEWNLRVLDAARLEEVLG